MEAEARNFNRELDLLRARRDELKLQLHLANAEMQDRYRALEKKWELLDEQLGRSLGHAGQSMHTIGAEARKLVDEIKQAYHSMKETLSAH